MSITPDKTLIVYNTGEPASLEHMTQYAKTRRIPIGNFLGVDTPTSDRYVSFEDFYNNLFLPVIEEITEKLYTCVILGYRIPSGFSYNKRVYSTASVISLFKVAFDGIPKDNPFYNVSDISKFNSALGKDIVICFNIDTRNQQQIKMLLERIKTFKNEVSFNGSFMLDTNHSINKYPNDNIYNDISSDFYKNCKRIFNVNIRKTTKNNNNLEPCFPILLGDSVFWGWGDLIANDSYFMPTNTNRILFLSYDNRSLTSIRSDGEDNACMSAINEGYLCVAGNIGDGAFTENEINSLGGFDVYDAYDPYQSSVLNNHVVPNPFVFMHNVLNEKTIGEALFLSRPYLHDSFMVIGDPFIKVILAETTEQEDSALLELWDSVERNLTIAASYLISEGKFSNRIHERNLKANDLDMKLRLSEKSNILRNKYGTDARRGDFFKTFEGFQSFSQQVNLQIYAYDDITFRDFLLKNNLFVSRSIINMFSNYKDIFLNSVISNIKLDRTLDIQLNVLDMDGEVGYIHFELEGALDDEFTQNLFTFKSYEDVSSWKYEKTPDKMEPFDQQGIFSGLIGRKVLVRKKINFKYDIAGIEINLRYRQVLNSNKLSNYEFKTMVITS